LWLCHLAFLQIIHTCFPHLDDYSFPCQMYPVWICSFSIQKEKVLEYWITLKGYSLLVHWGLSSFKCMYVASMKSDYKSNYYEKCKRAIWFLAMLKLYPGLICGYWQYIKRVALCELGAKTAEVLCEVWRFHCLSKTEAEHHPALRSHRTFILCSILIIWNHPYL
jgi:hypothetical protein